MWLYWFLFAVPAWRAVTYMRPVENPDKRWEDWWRVVFVLLVLAIGLRHEVGGDWFNYVRHIESVSSQTLLVAVSQGDPAYSLLNWLGAKSGLGTYFVNTVSAAIFSWGLVVFCRAQPRPWLALVVSIPYLVTVVAMGYTRQSVAIGLAMLALVALTDRKLLRFVVFVALAATFHKSAVILMPLAVLAGTKHRLWTAFWVGLASVIFYVLLLQESVAALQSGYIDAQYQSQGAALRLAMNAVPAVVFLCLRHRFVMPPDERNFWTWMSLVALGFVVLLVVSPSSTAVDRVALYWIPLQLYVLSRLPHAMGGLHGDKKWWVGGVVVYSGVVLFVWLVFATHAFAWLPYQFYPWVAFWR
jgi:hypothetical protein